MRSVLALFVGVLLCGCGGKKIVNTSDGGSKPVDLAATEDINVFPEVDLDVLPNGACDDTHPCAGRQRCYQNQCVADNGSCTANDECQNDTWCFCQGGGGADAGPCLDGFCVPYGSPSTVLSDPDCATPGFTPDKFQAPKLKCGKPGTTTLSTTIVADLDGDKKPEIIYDSYPDGFTALHGKDCTVYFDKKFTFASSGQSQLAVADLDADKVPEIIGVDSTNHVIVMDNKGTILATSPTPAGNVGWGGPTIADVDGKAPPEILVGGQAVRYVKGQNQLDVLYTNSPKMPSIGPLSVVADLDGDKVPELITGVEIYNAATGVDKTPPNLVNNLGGAYPAIGDFNKDKKPDIVLVYPDGNTEAVAIYDYANKKFLFGPVTLPDTKGGPPTVADFDGDGRPEFATAGHDHFYVFKPSCLVQNGKPPKGCDQNSNVGLLWQKNTQDHSSGVTGSSVFDFNGDGKAEVVYRDECWLRVYNGVDGRTLFAATVTSATAYELPVIADVDNDGHADIVVSSDSIPQCPNQPEVDTMTPWGGATSGVLVFQDPKNRWMPSRPLWNQHAYHITNVNDNMSIPTVEMNNWATYNNYRQNVQGSGAKPTSVPDFTGQAMTGVEGNGSENCANAWTLHANLCNRGTAPIYAGAVGSFYMSDPRQGAQSPICTTDPTVLDIDPGTCTDVKCDWKSPPQTPVDLWFRANDDGNKANVVAECHNGNDLLFLPRAECRQIM